MNQKRFEKRTPMPKVVGAARNSFGTRVCQRIECSRCHQVDYVSLKIGGAKTKYCRTCAERLLETYESGRLVQQKKLKCTCMQCKCEFEVNEAIVLKKKELLCRDCLRGFEVWQGKISQSNDEKKMSYVIKRSKTTVLRKAINDTI
ncbi:MAG: hypothetical protein KC505_08955 [Myxococcales bacterium]|nr:hypothetical protein [Myxococcales bacterium]USN51787.1 MAG: hypothetical protein H6731_05110 [Myxococcales bacterium]